MPIGKSVQCFLINDLWGMGNATPEKVVLGGRRKQAEQTRMRGESGPARSFLLCLQPQFLPRVPAMTFLSDGKANKPFSPLFFLTLVTIYHCARKLTNTRIRKGFYNKICFMRLKDHCDYCTGWTSGTCGACAVDQDVGNCFREQHSEEAEIHGP